MGRPSLSDYESRLREMGIGLTLEGDTEEAALQLRRLERTTRKALHAVMAEGAKRGRGERVASTGAS